MNKKEMNLLYDVCKSVRLANMSSDWYVAKGAEERIVELGLEKIGRKDLKSLIPKYDMMSNESIVRQMILPFTDDECKNYFDCLWFL